MAVNNSLAKKQKMGLTAYLTQDAVKNQINSVVGGKNGTRFVSSIISAVQTTPTLQECTNPSILSAALLGEALNLSPSPQLGQFYMVPFDNKKKGCKEAQFQLGYKWLEDNQIAYAVIGVDFGGTKSAHSFTLTGFTKGFKQVVVLDEYYCKKRINPKQLQDDFIDFVRRAQSKYKVYEAYCDSAEQTLISGLEMTCIQEHVVIDIKNAIKGPINDRIAFYNSLIAQHRWKVMKHCTHIIAAFEEAVYDEKKKNMDVRLDDGEMNVDSLDSTEYSTESIQDEIMYIAA